MDFRFTEEQEFFRSQVRDAVDRMIVPHAEEIDESEEFPRELWNEFAALGFFGLRYPEEYGGLDADTTTSMIFFEELARGSNGFSMAVTVQMLMGTYFVARFGSEAIKQRCLVPAIRGEKIAAVCFTENQSGSDLGGTRTTATREGDDWIVHGTKQWVTNGPVCDFATVLATTDPDKGLRGLDFFLVETDREGVSHGQVFPKLGSRGSATGELVFDQVRVPAECFLGDQVGNGVRHTTDILNEVRVMTRLNACAIAHQAMNDAPRYAGERAAFGRPSRSFPPILGKFGKVCSPHAAAPSLL